MCPVIEPKTTTRALLRPLSNDTLVARGVALKLLPEVLAWCDPEPEDEELKIEILDDLIKVLDRSWDWSGYELAKSLDDEAWSTNSELAGILDAAAGHRWDVHAQLVKDWVYAYQIKPLHSIGDHVEWSLAPREPNGKTLRGVIIEIDYELARYTVELMQRDTLKGKDQSCKHLVDCEKIDGAAIGVVRQV